MKKMVIGDRVFEIGKRTYVMGILNVTPDSFSDGGKFNNIDKAVSHARDMIAQGADIIDVGGESTRPGHTFLDEKMEIERIVPVIEALTKEIDVPISIDTYKSGTAKAAVLSGASMINDIWGLKYDRDMARTAAKLDVPCCIMHNRKNSNYDNIIVDILKDLEESINIALEAGIRKENIILDPGIGFAKNYEQNLEIMNQLEKFKEFGYPLLLGTSRKSMIGNALDLPVGERVEGTCATTVIGIMKGFDFVRVHDVLQNKRACIMTDTILRGR